MKIIVAKNIGFCSGVKRAVRIAKNSLKGDPKPVRFLGEIVHNEEITKKIQDAGGELIAKPSMAKSGTLVIRAHGVAPFNEPKNVLVRDATCPLVKRVHLVASSLHKGGYRVIIIGDKKHVETKGIKGYAQNQAIIIEDEEQAKNLPKLKKIGIVAQTTQNIDKFTRIVEILKHKEGEVKFYNTICPEVQERQKELNLILKKAKGILVIGSSSSANAQRLAGIVKKNGKAVWQINSAEKLRRIDLKDISVLGIVSGTSAPDWTVQKIVSHFKNK